MTNEADSRPEGLPLDTPADDEGRASRFSAIAAAHAVFSGARHATRLDLLISTIVELLRQSSLTADEIYAGVRREWPGAGVSAMDVDEALQVAASDRHQLLVSAPGLTGTLWHLTDHGRADVEVTKEWMTGFRRRLIGSIGDRAADSFRSPQPGEAEQWADRLMAALTAGISAADEAYLGAVDLLQSSSVLPVAADQGLIQQRLVSGASADVADFLLAAAIAALDPTDPFGNELVTVVSTSCILHGFLARLDQAEAQRRLGPLQGQEVVLDTPMLISLVSGAAVRRPIERIIAAARDSGVSVLALEHYLDEFADLALGGEPASIRDLVNDPRQRAAFIALSERDSVQAAYAQSLDEGAVRSWEQFVQKVRGFRARLEEIGVEVRPAGNHDSAQVERCRQALEEVLAESNNSHRTQSAISRDAETLSLALRHRRRFKAAHPTVTWPGLFVLTHDRRLGPAFSRIDPRLADVPLVLQPATLGTMLARARPASEVASLTEAAGQLLVREVANRVAIRYPPEVAAELATTLGGVGGEIDVRVAQFPTVAAVVEAASERTAARIEQEVQQHRTRRAHLSMQHANAIQETERQAAHRRVTSAALATARVEGERDAVEARSATAESEVARLRSELSERPTHSDVEALSRRASIRTGVAAATLAIGVCTMLLAFWPWGLGAIGGSALWWLQTGDWARDRDVRLQDNIVGIGADSLGVVLAAVGFLRHWIGG